MIWFCLVCYVLASQLAMFTALQMCRVEDLEANNQWLHSLDAKRKRMLVRVAKIAAVVAGPLLVPFIVLDCTFGRAARLRKSEISFWKAFKRRYRPLVLDPVHRYNLDKQLWAYIEDEQPVFDALNYQVLGEFLLKDEPLKIESRLLLHPDGNCIAELGRVGENFYVELTSFLDDGSVVCSSSGSPLEIGEQLRKERYMCFAHPDADALELIEQHERNLQESVKSRGFAIRSILEHRWKEYFRYNNQRFGQILRALDEHDNGPESVEFPEKVDSRSVRTTTTPKLESDDVPSSGETLKIYKEPV